MPYTTLSGIALQVPTRGTRNWDAVYLASNQQLIAQHQHTGSPDGFTLITASYSADSVTDPKIRLTNTGWLRGRNAAGTADINLIRVTSGDQVEVGGPLVGGVNTLDAAYDQGGAGVGRVITADSGKVEINTDGLGVSTLTNLGTGNLPIAASTGSAIITFQDTAVTTAASLQTLRGAPFYDEGNEAGATATIDFANGDKQKFTLTGNITTLNLNNHVSGRRYTLHIFQDATGGRTITWPAAVKWPENVAPTLRTVASGFDLLEFISDGTNLYSTDHKVRIAEDVVIFDGATGSTSHTVTSGNALPISSTKYAGLGTVTRSGNDLTFTQTGTYLIEVDIPSIQSNPVGVVELQLRLRNTTDSTTLDNSQATKLEYNATTNLYQPLNTTLVAPIADVTKTYQIQGLFTTNAPTIINPGATVGGETTGPLFRYIIRKIA